MNMPPIVSPQEWETARQELLVKEKELTRARDALNAERRRLPMVKVEKAYAFEGPNGPANLLDLFEGRRQLFIQHFMFHPDWDAGCRSCSAWTDQVARGHLNLLHARLTTLAIVSRAPLAKIEPFRERMGWSIPWYSSYGSDFNYDYGVTIDEEVAPAVYNYRTREDHEAAGTGYYFLDLTPLGRQEPWEKPEGRARTAPSAGGPIPYPDEYGE